MFSVATQWSISCIDWITLYFVLLYYVEIWPSEELVDRRCWYVYMLNNWSELSTRHTTPDTTIKIGSTSATVE